MTSAWHRCRAWPGTLPLRVKLIASVLLIAFAGLMVAGATTLTSLHSYLIHRVDNQLTAFEGRGGGPGFSSAYSVGGGFGQPQTTSGGQSAGQSGGTSQTVVTGGGNSRPRLPSEFYVVAYTASGTRIGPPISSPLGQQSPPRIPKLTAATIQSLQGKPFTVSSINNDSSWRVLISASPGSYVSVTALSLSDVDSTVDRLLWLEIAIGIAVLALMGGAGYFVVRRSLRPLAEVEVTAEAIAGGDLSQRVPDADPRTEVGRLAQALNGMLAQIETAFDNQAISERQAHAATERMRQFVADASHELRTPLTSIRGFSELYRMGAANEAAEIARLMSRIETEASRMGLLVEDLLLLARLDQQRPLEQAPVDLLTIASDVVHDAKVVDPSRTIKVVTSAEVPPIVTGDESRLRQVTHNLMTNALNHTPAGTPITISLRTGGDASRRTAVLEVIDQGPGLTAEQAAHVFERFYRVDAARTRDAGGAGLGLSIVAELVAAQGGVVSVQSEPGLGATFRVELPLRATEPATELGTNPQSRLTGATQEELSELSDKGHRAIDIHS